MFSLVKIFKIGNMCSYTKSYIGALQMLECTKHHVGYLVFCLSYVFFSDVHADQHIEAGGPVNVLVIQYDQPV